MRTVPEIIRAAGGARSIHEASNGALTKDAIYKWPSIGIPDRHWSLVMTLSGATPEELFNANTTAREKESAA